MQATAFKSISDVDLSKLQTSRVRIRRRNGGGGFYHQGKVVAEGEEVVCDFDIAAQLIAAGKAERVD